MSCQTEGKPHPIWIERVLRRRRLGTKRVTVTGSSRILRRCRQYCIAFPLFWIVRP
jgi:hypothetical protein